MSKRLEKMAKELAPAYNAVGCAVVEDDVGLCSWVAKQTGTELTLADAEKLRELLDAEVDSFPKVVI